MPISGLSLFGLKRITGFVSILRSINPTIIIIMEPQQAFVDARGQYPKESKPIYLRLKGLHRKKLSLASTIKIMEGKLAKNNFPTSVDFKFDINSTRNPILKDAWSTAIRKCKRKMTLALIDDLQKSYYHTKALIAKDKSDLERLLKP